MVLYGVFVMLLFYSGFITFVIITEPPRLIFSDAVLWGWVWGGMFGFCTYMSLKLYWDIIAGKVRTIECEFSKKYAITIFQVLGYIISACLICMVDVTDVYSIFGYIWLLLSIGFILICVFLFLMCKGRKQEKSSNAVVVDVQKDKVYSKTIERCLFLIFVSVFVMTMIFAILSYLKIDLISVSIYEVFILALFAILSYLFWWYYRKRCNKQKSY